MLKILFQWLDHHPHSYWGFAGAASVLLIGWLGMLLARDVRGTGAAPRPGWRDGAILLLFLLAWLWPFLLVANDYNPDESQLIAGALTLAHDPVFWRSVDGGSSGPFNYYLLVPWHWLGAPLDYFTARLTGILLTWGALFVCLRTLAGAFGRLPAWLGILPAAACLATVGHPELTNLSTEHLPLFLIAAAFGLLAGRAPPDRIRLWAACFIAGTLPWTKLQTAPIALVLLSWAGGQALREPGAPGRLNWRRGVEALLAGVLPSLLLAGMAVTTGQMETAWRRYFLQNILYVGHSPAKSVADTVRGLWSNAQSDGRFPLLLGTVLAGLLAATGYALWRRLRPSRLQVAAGCVSLVALAVVIVPRREFLHYLLLLPVPLTLWLGAALGGWWRHLSSPSARRWLAAGCLGAGLLPLVTRAFQPIPPIYGDFSGHWRHPRTGAAVILHALAGRGDTLGLWGWACYLHVESGLPQATRDGNTLWSIESNPQQAYHRAVYLADLKKSAPAVFVDAVGLGAFHFNNRSVQAHETFPELANYIRENYSLVVDLTDTRIYARKGLARLRDLDPVRLWQLVGSGRQSEHLTLAPPSSVLDKLQQKYVGNRKVVMLLPPAQVEWLLVDEVREVSLEFGFDPIAYERGASNGAELILELADGATTHSIYHRFLDPARVPADRGPQQARVTLPPYALGSHLILRTDPGQYGDTAWDWVYLASLKLHRGADPK